MFSGNDRKTPKEFGSIAQAVHEGCNLGMGAFNTTEGLREIGWRLLGDCIEFKNERSSKWMRLKKKYYEHPGIITAKQTHWSTPAAWTENAESVVEAIW